VQCFSPHKTIVVDLEREGLDLSAYGDRVSVDGSRATFLVPKFDTARVTGRLLADLPVVDLTVEEPPIEDVIEQVFSQESAENEPPAAGGPA
jgi:ABC-2 type transport system ATP-binding protein